MKNITTIMSNLEDKQRNVAKLQEDLKHSIRVEETMPDIFEKGSFAVITKGRNDLPFCSKIKYKECGTEAPLTFAEWVVLTKRYYSPHQLKLIEKQWVISLD